MRLPVPAPSFVRTFWRTSKRNGVQPVALELKGFWYARDRLRLLLDVHTRLHQGGSTARDAATALARQLGYDSPELALTAELTLANEKQVVVGMDIEGAEVGALSAAGSTPASDSAPAWSPSPAADPFSGVVYVFRAKRADRVKLVFWDGTGVCLFANYLGSYCTSSDAMERF